MNPTTLRVLGFLLLIAAVAAAILNLKRVAAIGMPWLPAILVVLGAACLAMSRRRTS